MITRIIKSKTLKQMKPKHISCNCRCKLYSKKLNSNQKCSNNKCWCLCEKPLKHRAYEEDYVLNRSICSCEISEYSKSYAYMKSFSDDSVVSCDEVINTLDTVSIDPINKIYMYIYRKEYYIFHT